ncbi:hypothetical protein [Adhaeribacter pallidiroseus]|uniref:Uncharacterized protein n=1 Tax=Adhaeribacter pallidiroseus TaxID=2072847 RepID=A0A369QKN5_9BACT|nr:hypothetical protein [Adhaeribacter pallidiroseus]RDC63817.1 hypothetical protein AHMF7616_02426 [Adhaeribacter pallidiroseus]
MKNLFLKIEKARTSDYLDILIESYPKVFSVVKDFELKYPRLPFNFTLNDLQKLKSKGIITDENLLDLQVDLQFTELKRLLLAVLWKNGHITRIQSVLDGIGGTIKSKTDYGVIFRQFGKSLAEPNEPIVDQHVLRAYCEYGNLKDVIGRNKVPRKSVFKSSDQSLIDSYRKWLANILANVKPEERNSFKYKIDKIMFAIGKLLD